MVGAGTTGCVVAARLSEDPARSVLLLEGGPDGVPSGLDPFAALAAPGRTWPGVNTVMAKGQAPRPYWQGRGVGGSSAVNGMVAAWGAPGDYDRWGVERWSGAALERARAKVEAVLRPRRIDHLGPLNQWFADRAPAAGFAVEALRVTAGATGRWSVREAYLEPARRRPNLEVRPDTAVTEVLIQRRRAQAVRLADGTEIEAPEVVVSAGALQSPFLLRRSGVDRPGLGANLHDHPGVRVVVPLPTTARVADRRRLPFGVGARRGAVQLLPMDYADDLATGGVVVALLDARSRGAVDLDADPPVAHFDHLTDERDRVALRAGLASVESVLVDFGAVEVPAVDALGDVYHAAGTCRMGSAADPGAVVDGRLRVVGYDGLRVADASVMPRLPPAPPMLTGALIGERLAELW